MNQPTLSAGILLHPTSLPTTYGAGDLGPAVYRFALSPTIPSIVNYASFCKFRKIK